MHITCVISLKVLEFSLWSSGYTVCMCVCVCVCVCVCPLSGKAGGYCFEFERCRGSTRSNESTYALRYHRVNFLTECTHIYTRSVYKLISVCVLAQL